MTEAEARRNFIEATINAGAGVYVDIDAVAEMLRVEEELQQYKAIGTVEELKELKEKQIAKKPRFIVRMNGIIKMYLCPCCTTDEEYTQVYPKQRHCEKCGQALAWADSEV